MLNRRRTLFQSFDAARFKDENARAMGVSRETLEQDAEEDIALARCELLGAMLFGHQIVVPAGSVADSQAFVQLLTEVFEPSRQQRAKIASLNRGEPYFPFIVGLEPRFREKADGLSGYDAFVRDYLGNYSPDRIDTRVIAALSAKIGRSPEEAMVLVGNAYLTGKIDELETTVPEYATHVRWVLEQFSHRVLRPAPDAFSATNQFKEASPTIYARAIEFCCREVEQHEDVPGGIEGRGAGNQAYNGLEDIRRVSKEIVAKLKKDKRAAEARERGVWYKHGTMYGEHWPVVRNWLDRRIHDMFVDGYEVSIPSYFTQKLPAGAPTSAALAYLRNLGDARRPGVAPGDLMERLPFNVPWGAVWDILAEPEVQHEMAVLQAILTGRLEQDRALGNAGHPAPGTRAALQEADRAQARVDTIGKALDHYVDVINRGQTHLHLDPKTGIVTGLKPKPAPNPIVEKGKDVAGGAAVGTVAGVILTVAWPASGGLAIPAGAAVGGAVNMASGVAWEGMKAGMEKLVGTVRRKPDEPLLPALSQIEQERLSIWTTSSDWTLRRR